MTNEKNAKTVPIVRGEYQTIRELCTGNISTGTNHSEDYLRENIKVFFKLEYFVAEHAIIFFHKEQQEPRKIIS